MLYNNVINSFLQYVRASAAGLRAVARSAANLALPLSGPAGLFKRQDRHPLCWGLVEECSQRPAQCPVEQISFHKKGGGAAGGFADGVVRESARLVRQLWRRFPTLAQMPVANTEADPESGWWRPEEWRVDARYAAMLARVAVLAQKTLVREMNLKLVALGNDNAFLSTRPFDQRTLLARFQMKNTESPHTQFVQKPVYAAAALMALLGDRELSVSIQGLTDRAARKQLAILAAAGNGDCRNSEDSSSSSGCSNEESRRVDSTSIENNTDDNGNPTKRDFSMLLVWGGGANPAPTEWMNLTIAFDGLQKGTLVAVWQVDCVSTNPFKIWEGAGSPAEPPAQLRAAMRAVAGPHLVTPPRLALGNGVSVTLPPPAAVTLVQACEPPSSKTHKPGAPSRLIALNVTVGEVLLLWSDQLVNERCLLGYEILHRPVTGVRRSITVSLLRVLNYHYAPHRASAAAAEDAVRGEYSVRAVDFWQRKSPYAAPVRYAL